MKLLKLSTLVLAVFIACMSLHADTALHKFGLWTELTKVGKLDFYMGWTNGFLQARGESVLKFADCLSEINPDQALAMIDKRATDHPELWSRPIGEQVLEALTVDGGPCQGKNPLVPAP